MFKKSLAPSYECMVKFIAVNLNAVTKSKFELYQNYAFVNSPLGSASFSILYAAYMD